MLIHLKRFSDTLFQIVDRFMALDRKVIEDASFAWIKGHPKELFLDQPYLRNWQRDVHIWLKGHRHTIAIWALDSRLV